MINLLIDEAYYIDFLSILEIKLSKAKDVSKEKYFKSQIKFYKNNLAEQIGDNLLKEIQESTQYKKLKEVNKDIFELIDYCTIYKVDFKTATALNYIRFTLKNEIQKEFFGKVTSEVKIGYNKENK